MTKPVLLISAAICAFSLFGGISHAEVVGTPENDAIKRQQARQKFIEETRAINKKRLQEIEERQQKTLRELNKEREKNGFPPFGKAS